MKQWIKICQQHIASQLDALKNGEFTLNCPSLPKKIKYTQRTHYHTTPEISSQISGTHMTHFPGQSIQVNPGDITIIPATLPHFITGIQNKSSLFMFVDCEQSELWIGRGNIGLDEKLPSSTLVVIKTKQKEKLKEYLNSICVLSNSQHKASRFAIQGILLTYFSELLMILDKYESSEQFIDSPKIITVQRLVFYNFKDSRLNVDFISRLIPCSPGHLSQLFYKKTGIKLSKYINEKRLEYAKQLLKTTNMNITEVAYSCGYSDPSYFIRIFRQTLGVSPRKYRKGLIK